MKYLPKDCVIAVNPFGSKISYKNGRYHSFNDQPAYRNIDGEVWYYKDSKCHRDYDKPAIILMDGAKCCYYYCKEGKEYFLENEELT